MIIDSHQHFWTVSRSDYGWLAPGNAVLYRDYLPADLAPILSENAISATLLIQAAPSEAETRYLLELAQAHPFVAGVVGWVDFESPDVERRIGRLIEEGKGKLKGLRPMIQDIDEADWVRRSELDPAFQSMTRHGLVFDALVKPAQLRALRERLVRHGELRAVLDHVGKPNIEQDGFAEWAKDIEQLARDTAVAAKLSGILTEAGPRSSCDELSPYIQHVFQCFGPDRILWGSDWPVLNLASDYARWLKMSKDFVQRFAPHAAEAIFAGTAARLYHLELPAKVHRLAKARDLPA